MFVILMSIVLINLVIGLSISDVVALRLVEDDRVALINIWFLFRKDAHIHKVINTVSAIRSVHTLKENLSRMFRRGNGLSKRKSSEKHDKVILTSDNL